MNDLLIIYGVNGQPITGLATRIIPASDDSEFDIEIMLRHQVNISFKLDSFVKLGLGCYIIYNGIKYTILTESKPEKSGVEYKYSLTFEAPEMRFRNKTLFYPGVSREPEWSYSGSVQSLLDIFIENIQYNFGETWTIGAYPTQNISIRFSSDNIFDGLTKTAEACGLEWWADGMSVNIARYETGVAVDVKEEEIISKITPSKSNNKFVNRIYAFGSTRNIPASYRRNPGDTVSVQGRLKLPVNIPYIEPDMQVIDGLPVYVGRTAEEVIDAVKIYDDIYPSEVMPIARVFSYEGVDYSDFYISQNIVAYTEDFDLSDSELYITFQTGLLAGRTFDVKYQKVLEFIKKASIFLEESHQIYLGLTGEPPVGEKSDWYNKALLWRSVLGDYTESTALFSAALAAYGTDTNEDDIIDTGVIGAYLAGVAANWTGDTLQDWYDAILVWETAAANWYTSVNTNWFKIITKKEGTFYLPNETLVPAIDDEFILFGFNVNAIEGSQYITDAENDLLQTALSDVQSQAIDENTYECPINSFYCVENSINLNVGQRVKLYSPLFDGYRESRIFGFKKKLFKKEVGSYLIGDTSKYSKTRDLEKKVKKLSEPSVSESSKNVEDLNNMFTIEGEGLNRRVRCNFNFYSVGTNGALGAADEIPSSGGGIVNILNSWTDYTPEKANYALSASLGYDLYTKPSYSITEQNKSDWTQGFNERLRWAGGSNGLDAVLGRTSLGLGSAALYSVSDFDSAGTASGLISTHNTTYNHSDIAIVKSWGNHASAGYLTGITSLQVTEALGFTPISGITSLQVTEALGYTPISGITSLQVTEALGYTPYNASNPSNYAVNVSMSSGYIPYFSSGLINTALYYSSSKLGFGTTTPDSKFHIYGSYSTSAIHVANTYAPGFSDIIFNNDQTPITGGRFSIGLGGSSSAFADQAYIITRTASPIIVAVNNIEIARAATTGFHVSTLNIGASSVGSQDVINWNTAHTHSQITGGVHVTSEERELWNNSANFLVPFSEILSWELDQLTALYGQAGLLRKEADNSLSIDTTAYMTNASHGIISGGVHVTTQERIDWNYAYSFSSNFGSNLNTGYLPYKASGGLANSGVYFDGTNIFIGYTSNPASYKLAVNGSVYVNSIVSSGVTTGTAPFYILSTTLNTNLNADLWDGYQFADYLNQAVRTSDKPKFTGLRLTNGTSAQDIELIIDANGALKFVKSTGDPANIYATGTNAALGAGEGLPGGGNVVSIYNDLSVSRPNVLTDTFNAYTIKSIHDRLVTVEGSYISTLPLASSSLAGIVTLGVSGGAANYSHTHPYASVNGNPGQVFYASNLYANQIEFESNNGLDKLIIDAYGLWWEANNDYAIKIENGLGYTVTSIYYPIETPQISAGYGIFGTIYEGEDTLSSIYAALAGNQAVAFKCSDLQSYGQVDIIGVTYSTSYQTGGIYSVYQGENIISFDHATPSLNIEWPVYAPVCYENGVSLSVKYAAATHTHSNYSLTSHTHSQYVAWGSAKSISGVGVLTADTVQYYTLTNLSDIRLKKNINPITEGISLIDKLRPVTFEWNNRVDTLQVGLIANEVQDVLPFAVKMAGDYLGIEYNKIIPYLIQGEKDLYAEIKTLKNRVFELETKLSTLN